MFGRDSVVISPSLRQPLTVDSTGSTSARQTGRRAPSALGPVQRDQPRDGRTVTAYAISPLPRWHPPIEATSGHHRTITIAPCNAGSQETSSPNGGHDFHRHPRWHRTTGSRTGPATI